MEVDVFVLDGGVLHHAGAGDDGRLGAFLVDLDDGVLLDEVQIAGVVGHGPEVGPGRIEGGGHPHLGEDVVQLDVVLGLEAGEPKVHLAGDGGILPSVLLQIFGDVGDGMLRLGKKDRHGEGAVAVGEADCLEDVILGVAVGLGLLHHLDLALGTGFVRERFVGRGGFLELVLPVALEVHRIQEIAEHVGVDPVQDFGNHAVGVVVAPAVDGLQGAVAVPEVQVRYLGFVVSGDIGLVGVLQGPAVVHEDGACDGELRLLVQGRELPEHRQAELVHGPHLPGAVAEDVADLLRGPALRSVQDHPEQELHAEQGNDVVGLLIRVDPVDELEGEGHALVHEFGGPGAEFDGVDGIVDVVGRLLAGNKAGQQGGEKEDMFHTRSFSL